MLQIPYLAGNSSKLLEEIKGQFLWLEILYNDILEP